MVFIFYKGIDEEDHGITIENREEEGGGNMKIKKLIK